ncbi:hypothetical protein NY057_05100 [Curtobacterium flaccumfaciens]|uniref:Acb2/Tad1 domain-containing protein n=1 Tax=Curtobacterium flaccumfaciens TaxID=2035 RepID=UPI0022002F16|nr:hypothetical protein [Curtobacterium flaccumfaciens]UWD83623.1 hypothetical protein NY057_05100 [Curtobacterium flaccumfaciens]
MSTTFRSKPVEVEAMQTAPADPMVAEKDREEQNRLVAQWISNGGGEVIDFGRAHITIDTRAGEEAVFPGNWIVRDPEGNFSSCAPDTFAATFEQAIEAASVKDETYARGLLRAARNGEEPTDEMVKHTLALAAADEYDAAARERFFTASEQPDVVALRDRIVALGAEIDRRVPGGRNKSLALTALEDVQMRGNRGIFAPEHLR